MSIDIDSVRFIQSRPQVTRDYYESHRWGMVVFYMAFEDDRFAGRQVDAYENGYLVRYDRLHWQDQFGSLADFRFGKLWIKHWGQPLVITEQEFEIKWSEAEQSPPFGLRKPPPEMRPPWIDLFKSGRWQGQA